jgi:hypothetical protein
MKLLVILAGIFAVQTASAIMLTPQTIEILCTPSEPCGKSTGTTADGTIFQAEPNPTQPSTGTGVFQPFVRIQDSSGTQNGYNTDAPNNDPEFDTKSGPWTHSVQFGDLGTIDIGGVTYYGLSLDANENGQAQSLANQIDITDIQIYVGDSSLKIPENNGGYTGTLFDWMDNALAGLAPVWQLDGLTNGDVTAILQASICDTNGQCGSGKGDLNVFIPTSLFTGSPNDYFVLYTEYDRVGSGFEEWRYLAAEDVPGPGTLVLLSVGLLGISFVRKLRMH